MAAQCEILSKSCGSNLSQRNRKYEIEKGINNEIELNL